MTLRLRLVLALMALVLCGLTLFGAATYSFYARSQYDRLDDQIRSSVPILTRQLTEKLGEGRTGDRGPSGGGPGGNGPDQGLLVPLATYAELRDASGKVLTSVRVESSGKPALPSHLERGDRFSTAESEGGSARWRVFATGAPDGQRTVVVAVPSDEVSTALHRLILTEVVGGAVVVAIVVAGAWLIVRRGLRPLERMAGTAGEITAGDMSRRVALTDTSSEVGHMGIAFNTMLDEIERAFAERDATEQRLRQFLADASHELRTPLTSIQGFAELYRIGDEGRVDLPTILRRIEEESARMKVLVEDLLLLARLDETRPVELAPVDLTVLAADACSDAAAAAPERPVTLDAPEPVVVSGDEALLRQAIANLVANAMRHTPSGTAIDVGSHLDDHEAVVTVRDHGPGIEPDALERVFDRFWQADAARAGASTGLGLSIVAGVAAEHGGTASAANAADGGAVFELRLPR